MQSETSLLPPRILLVHGYQKESFPKSQPSHALSTDLQYALLKACTPPELVTKMDFSPDGIPLLDILLLLQKYYIQLTSFTMIYLTQQHQKVFFLSQFNGSLQERTLDYSSTRLGNRTKKNAISTTQSSCKSKCLNVQVYFYPKSSRYIVFSKAGNLVFKEKVCGQEKP